MTKKEWEIRVEIPDDPPCKWCGEQAAETTCCVCGVTAKITNCGHMRQPRPIAAGRADGSRMWETYCETCSVVA